MPVAQPPLSLRTKLLYGVGSIAYGVKGQLMSLLLLFYNQLVGLPPEQVSLVLMISVVLDAVWDPIIGQYSDNLRSPLGRRHTLMYASAVPAALTFIMLWHPPAGWSDGALCAYLLVMVMLARFTISLYEIPSSALAPELAPDYHARTSLLAYRYLFGTLGTAGAAIMAYGIFLKSTPDQPMGQLNADGYPPYALTVAIIMTASILISTAATHHRIKGLHTPPARKLKVGESMREIGATLANRNFVVAIIAMGFTGVAIGLISGLHIYFATYFWELPSSKLLILTLSSVAAAPIAAIYAPRLSRRLGKRNGAMALGFAGVVFNCLPVTLRLLGFFPENGSPYLLPLLLADRVMSGICSTGMFILTASMLADIVEQNQAKTGRRAEGLLMSADNTLQKIITGLATGLPGFMLAAIGFPEKAVPGRVDPEVLRTLGLIYVPTLAILSSIGLLIWRFYRIDEKTHEQNLATVQQAAAAGETAVEAGGYDAPEGTPARAV